MVFALLEVVRLIRDAEQEARRLLDEANVRTEQTRRNAEAKAEEAYKKVYQDAVAEARRKFEELEKQAKESAEHDAQSFLQQAEKQVRRTRTKSEQKLDEAAQVVLDDILAGLVK